MSFKKIKGHAQALSRISQEINNKTFEGAFLFSGPIAVGKYTIARAIGKYLTCGGLQDDNCRCENCRLFPAVPDYMEICNGNDMITVDDVEPITNFLTLKAFRGGSRVVVIDNAHNMNTLSANRLLKIMEELPPQCVIILVSEQPDKLLPPLYSRCYRMDFSALGAEDIKSIVKGLGHDVSEIGDLGRMLPYLSESVLLNFSRYADYIKSVPKFLKDITTMSEDELVAYVKDIEQKEDVGIFLDVFLIHINDLFKLRYDSPDVICSVRKIDYLEELTDVWKEDLCVVMMEKIRIIQGNIKKKINLKPGQLLLPCMLWLYYFIKKSNKPKVEAV